MAASIDWDGIDRIKARIDRAVHIDRTDFRVLGEDLERIIVEDNRKGVMEGTDKDGKPLAPVTYRTGKAAPVQPRSIRGNVFGTIDFRRARAANARLRGKHLRFNNLDSSTYRTLTGPPTAPRGLGSRVITNLRTRHSVQKRVLVAEGSWEKVVNAQGRPFLRYLFEGTAKMPARDLRGVRPWGRQKALDAARAWAAWLLRT